MPHFAQPLGQNPFYVALGLVLLACSSVSDSDPSFWDPSKDLGGRQFGGFAPPGGAGGSGFGGAGAAGGFAGSAGFGGTAGFGGSSGFGNTPGVGGAAGTAGSPATGGSGGVSGSGTGGTGAVNSGPCSVTFDFTTQAAGGKYAPKNIGAVWILNPQNQFVKTLEVWAATRSINLVNWNAQTSGNRVDAISGATLSNHTSHQSRWDCTDVNHAVVPDGQYRIVVEFTESDSFLFFNPQPKLLSLVFPKGNGPGTVTPPNDPFFTNLSLTVQ